MIYRTFCRKAEYYPKIFEICCLASGSFVRDRCSLEQSMFLPEPLLAPPATAFTRSQTTQNVRAKFSRLRYVRNNYYYSKHFSDLAVALWRMRMDLYRGASR
jgi:hypothetical protein